jgi:hypothetical protein
MFTLVLLVPASVLLVPEAFVNSMPDWDSVDVPAGEVFRVRSLEPDSTGELDFFAAENGTVFALPTGTWARVPVQGRTDGHSGSK